jgi:hypothetical protein
MNTKKTEIYTNEEIRAAYDRVFSDEAIAEEQLAMTKEFELSGRFEGQEWY